MPLSKDKYKDTAFYSGFSYLHPVASGSVAATLYADPFFGNVYRIDATVPLPDSVVARPPYVRFFVFTQGAVAEVEANSNLYVGSDSNNIRIYSDGANRPQPYTVYYHIYDRTVA